MSKKSFVIVITMLQCFNMLHAQKKSWDIFSYVQPRDFQLKTNPEFLFFEKKEGKEYCQLFLYAATNSVGNTEADFKKAWDYFARNPSQNVNEPETKEADTSAQWHNYFGAARGVYNRKPFVVSISSFTRNGITFYTAAVFTAQQYLQQAKAFMESIEPDASKFVRKTNPVPVNNNSSAVTAANSKVSSNLSKRITKNVTTFNDGWTSTAYDDYISVINQGTEVRIIFPDAGVERKSPQNTSIFEPHFWDNMVRKYYRVNGQVLIREKPMYSYGDYDIWMAAVTDISTGRQGWLAMRLHAVNGNTTVITVFAASKEYIDANFNKSADFIRMLGYNKFSVTAADITGEWKSSSGSALEYYNVYTGASAGMVTAHVSDKFIFKSNGTYESEHTGTSTFQTVISHGKSNYSGVYKLNDVLLTITGRGADDQGEFYCYFEAVKMGFMLRLSNKKYEGINMILCKVK